MSFPDTPGVESERCPTCESFTREFAYVRGCKDPWHQRTCPTCGNIGEGEPWGTCPDPFHSVEQREQEGERLTLWRCPVHGLLDEVGGYGLPDTDAEGLPLCGLCPQENAHELTRVEFVPAAKLTQAEAERDRFDDEAERLG